MSDYDFDLFTIGAGSGGVRASRMSAQYGARVAVAEERYFGGTCVNVGCVPKKLFTYAAHFASEVSDGEAFGWTVGTPDFDWSRLIANKDREVARLNQVYRSLLERAGVAIFEGRARIVDAHTVEVNGERHRARYILVAAGSWPDPPGIPGQEHAITSNEAFFLESLPERLIITGAGYIAVEFAGIFNRLGVDVVIVHRGGGVLRGFDEDVRRIVAQQMTRKGVSLRLNTTVEQIEKVDRGYLATLSDGGRLEADLILCATGRRPNSSGLGLEGTAAEIDSNGAVIVDAFNCTTDPSIYAIGDITDRIKLTPIALAEGTAIADTLFNDRPTAVNYENVPSAVFGDPEVGVVGLREATARRRYPEVDVYLAEFTPLKHTLTGSGARTLMKLVVEGASQRVKGCHVVGEDAAEIVQGVAIALTAGATKDQFDATVGIHPTAAEELVTMRTKTR